MLVNIYVFVYVCTQHSAKRVDQLQQPVRLFCPKSRHSRLKQYCATRWVERHDSMFMFLELCDPLLKVLNDNEKMALAGQLTDPRFIISILILSKVLGLTKGISESLQSKQMDLISAVSEIECVVDTLTMWRNDAQDRQYSNVFAEASALYSKVEDSPEIEFPQPRLSGRQRNRNNVPAENA